MSPLYQRIVPLLARLLICAVFLLAGIGKITNWSGTEASMRDHGLTIATPVLLGIVIAVEILGGLALLVGFHVRVVAIVLFLFLIPATLGYHNFWAFSEAAFQQQLTNFLKNLAIMGGLLDVSVAGAGILSLDAARARRPFWAFWRRPAI